MNGEIIFYKSIRLIDGKPKWIVTDFERIYTIPLEVIVNRGKYDITITKNSSRSTWYDDIRKRYRIEEKIFNDIYHNMRIENSNVLRKN